MTGATLASVDAGGALAPTDAGALAPPVDEQAAAISRTATSPTAL